MRVGGVSVNVPSNLAGSNLLKNLYIESSSTGGAPEAVRSEIADDPDVADLLDDFAAGLDGHVKAMREALEYRYARNFVTMPSAR